MPNAQAIRAPVKRKERHYCHHNKERSESLVGKPLATFTQRLLAFCIDLLIVEVATANATEHIHNITADHLNINVFHDFVRGFWLLAYFGLAVWMSNGLTIGKRLMQIRILSLRDENITLWQAIERALGYGASAIEAGFGFFQYFLHPNRACVHDRIAETIVVKEPWQKKKEKEAVKKESIEADKVELEPVMQNEEITGIPVS